MLKLLSFQEQTSSTSPTEHSFCLAGQRFLILHCEIERVAGETA